MPGSERKYDECSIGLLSDTLHLRRQMTNGVMRVREFAERIKLPLSVNCSDVEKRGGRETGIRA